jgi:hypothetical protein
VGLWLNCQGLQHLAELKPGAIVIRWHQFSESEAVEIRGRVLLGWSLIARSSGVALAQFEGEMHFVTLPRAELAKRDVDKAQGRGKPVLNGESG